MAKLSRYLNSKFLRGSLLFTVASVVGSVLNYFFNIVVAKKLGPEGLGELAALFSYTAIFSVPLAVISMVLIQKIGAHKSNNREYVLALEEWFLHKVRKWGILIVPLLFSAPFIQRFTNLSIFSSYAVIPLISIGVLSSYYGALLQGLHLFGWLSFVGLVAVILKLGGAIAVSNGSQGILIIIAFLLFSNISTIIIPYGILRRRYRNDTRRTFKLNKRIFHAFADRQVIITLFSVLGITLMGNFDIVIAKKVLDSAQAGLYGSWSLFAKIILFGMGPLVTSSYIFFSSKKAEQNHEKVLHISLSLLVILGVISFILYQYFSPFIIGLFFGKKFNSVAPVLGLASIFGSLYTALIFINNYFLSKKSLFSLIVPFVVFFYMISLYFLGRNIISLIAINLTSACVILVIQIIGLLQYNTGNGTQKS